MFLFSKWVKISPEIEPYVAQSYFESYDQMQKVRAKSKKIRKILRIEILNIWDFT